ncbi:PREDICTED: tRNA A64-2'-O-ribosylphosphate transferase isoform X2 [Tarenaya hassleriana]|uniref:tRNA A64-2'-O-ribosylphosphate transferase isoform X2 n=1 Tax=Tarenaya hassleriana TaxID=28532 RepID=UPI00053C337B|nr:PREDICTED: tRNA A64-2'-O-ribosylphosphate transferase isoform X2 [Tarenaya hassleriana]
MGEKEMERQSIYRAARSVKRRDNSIYNALRSIYEDSTFVGEIRELWPEIPLVANLRCGLWYWRRFDATCYFKSTDGHTNNLSFNTSRLNLHLPLLAGQKGGCIIVDSTRKGKRFPDSMSKTIPIWACVLNRYMFNHFKKSHNERFVQEGSTSSEQNGDNILAGWDCSLHLPLWVPETEKAAIEDRLEEWTRQLDESGADITSIVSCLRKPLRPLWISQKTLIWLNEVPEHDSWDFTPIILLSASASSGEVQCRKSSELSWSYIPGAGDDEESWAKGLSPKLFWTHVDDLIDSGPDLCNQKVAEIIENDRVYCAQRGQEAPQVSSRIDSVTTGAEMTFSENSNPELLMKNPDEECLIFWLGSTNLAIGPSHIAYNVTGFDYVLNCDQNPIVEAHPEAHLHLPMTGSKFDRFSISRNLPSAVNFAKTGLSQGKKLLVCCHNGEDISVCVCLAILTSLFNEKGVFDGGSCFRERSVTKLAMRRRLIFICRYAVNARPSRGNLRQVFGFLSSRNEDSDD